MAEPRSRNTNLGEPDAAVDPWFCLPCAIALKELFTAPAREDAPNRPPRCPNCNRRMRLTADAAREAARAE